MSNPYAIMKQAKPMTPSGSTAQLPDINQQDKAKMGRSMKRRMSVSHNIDIGKVIQQQQQKEATPALPVGLLNQYQMQEPESHQYPGLPQNSLEKGLQRQRSLKSIRTFGSQRITSTTAPVKNGYSNLLNPEIAPPVPVIAEPVFNLSKGIDLHDQKVIKLLHDPNFNAESFISTRLSDATATDIERFSSNLTALNKKITNDMKSTALKTYDRLVNTSNELHLTESELKILRNVIAELLEVSNTMKETAERRVQLELEETSQLTKSKSVNKTRRVDRSSVLMLEKIWTNEMNSLFKHVEGAQKFISPIPGRHIIAECGRWYELNAATFKTLQPAHIFLLNDLILIATRRRKNAVLRNLQNDNSSKSNTGLIAEQCWPLRDVSLVEIKPNHQSKNENTYAIKVTYNSLTYIYQTDRFDHYQLILNGYKKSRDELRDISEAENIKQKQLRDSLNLLSTPDNILNLSSSSPHPKQVPSKRSSSQKDNHTLLNDLSSKMHGRSRSLENSSAIRTLKQVDENLNDVDSLIFRESFDEAIDKLDESVEDLEIQKNRCNEEELLFHNVIVMKISLKKDELLKNLINLMNSNSVTNNVEIENIVKSLIKLDQSSFAQTLFLNNRSIYLNSLVSKIDETKDLIGNPQIVQYLIETSIVLFQSVKTTIITYQNLFKQEKKSNLACLIQWSTQNIKDHLSFLQKKINNLTVNKEQMESLIMILHRQSNVLKDVGLDVEYALDEFYKSINSI